MSQSIFTLLVCPITKQNLFLLKGDQERRVQLALEQGKLRYMDGTPLSTEAERVQFLITENAHHLYSVIDGVPLLLESRQVDLQMLED